VRCYAPGFIFTAALPPAVSVAATAAIQHLKIALAVRLWHREKNAALSRAAIRA
jgi:5-aminolevulinate synthase